MGGCECNTMTTVCSGQTLVYAPCTTVTKFKFWSAVRLVGTQRSKFKLRSYDQTPHFTVTCQNDGRFVCTPRVQPCRDDGVHNSYLSTLIDLNHAFCIYDKKSTYMQLILNYFITSTVLTQQK